MLNELKVHFNDFSAPKYQNSGFCCYLFLLSTFSYPFFPRRESATFLFATIAVSRPGTGYNSFWFETDVVAFFQRFSHVVFRADPEIPESRFIVYASNRRFGPVWASLNRGFRGLIIQGDMQLKRNTTCEKRWKKCNNIGFEPKWIITSPYLQRTREYSNLGYVAHFI